MVFTAYDAMFYPPLKNVYRSIADMAKQRCSNALDIGSGTGTVCRMMRDRGINAIGIDIQWKMIRNAMRKGGEYILGNGYSLPFRDKVFDCVTMSFLLHGVSNHEKILQEAKRVMKRDGRMIITDYASSKNFASFVIKLTETFAREEHKRNYFSFMKNGGIDKVIEELNMNVEMEKNYYRGAMKSFLLYL